jgi:hypothetical protein
LINHTVHGIRLKNFKRFDSFYLSARAANILVGPNNSGKSSILDALRVCQACLRYTRTISPRPIEVAGIGHVLGYHLPLSSLPIPIANVTTNYNDQDATIEIRCGNGNTLVVNLHPEKPILFYLQSEKESLRTSKAFRAAFPLDLVVVPPLGPFEETELIVQEETVRRNESSRLANRYFRNIWRRKDIAEWDDFHKLVLSSWPGIDVKQPEFVAGDRAFVQMFYRENKGERELYWSGFGFQVWLQMLTHIMRGTTDSILVLDEPDIYLHPDLQRKLLRIVRERFGQFFMATHSVEIINEGEPGDVVSVHSEAKAGKRVLTDEEYQALFNYIGSIENIDFSRLGRARRIVFFEGNDKKLLRKFAQKLSATHFANDLDTTILQSGGFGQWRRVKEVAWTFREVLKLEVDIFAIFDRDYRSNEEVDKFLTHMKEQGIQCFVLQRKEIENYVLTLRNLTKVVQGRQQHRLRESQWLSPRQIKRLIVGVSNKFRHHTSSQIVAQRGKHFQEIRSRIDQSTVFKETSITFEQNWKDIDSRLGMLPGKDFIALLSSRLQRLKGFSITINMLMDSLTKDEISSDLASIIIELDAFCKR